MQKTSIALALVLILGCVSAIDFPTNTWKVEPKLIISNGTNDATFLDQQNSLVSSSKNSTLSLLNEKGTAPTYTQRIFNLNDFGAVGNDSSITMDMPVKAEYPVFIGDYVIFGDVFGTQPQQVRLIVTPLNGGAAAYYNLTKNTDNSTNFNIRNSFVHHNRYYIVYSDSGSNYNISGIDANGANINTLVLTTNGTDKAAVGCVGLSGQESAYCLFTFQNDTDGVHNLFEATVGLKGSSNKAPDAKAFNVNATIVPGQVIAYNAGKQYGGIYKVGDNWFYKTNKNATVLSLGSSVVDANHIKTPENFLAFNDDLAVFWSITELATSNKNYTSQHIVVNGTLTDTSVVANNVKSLIFTQYKDGSLYAAAGNSTDIYLGQFWGSTRMSASAIQSAFAIVLATVAALFLF